MANLFDASIVKETLEALAELPSITEASSRLEALVAILPKQLTSGSSSPSTELVLGESQQALVAGLPYLIATATKSPHEATIVPILKKIASNFRSLKLESSYGNVAGETFAFSLTLRLLESARLAGDSLPADFLQTTVLTIAKAVLPGQKDFDAVQWVQSVSMAASVGLLKALAISRYDWPSAELKEVQALIAPLCSHSIRGDIDKLLTDVAAGEHGDEAKQTLLAFKTLGTDISSSWFHIAYFQFVLRVTAVKALVHHASGHVEDKTTFRADWIHGRKTHQIVAQTSINARSQRLWNMVISNFGSAKNAAEHTLVNGDVDITDWKPFLDDAFKSLEAAVKSDNAYLDEYYENKSHPTDPSPFALLAVASQVTALIAWHDATHLPRAIEMLTYSILSPVRQPFVSEAPMVQCALDGIALLPCRFPREAPAALATLREFLMEPGDILISLAEEIPTLRSLLASLNHSLVTLLQVRVNEEGEKDFKKTFLPFYTSLTDSLYASTKPKHAAANAQLVTATILSSLVSLAGAFNTYDDLTQRVSSLMRKFFVKSDSSFDKLLVESFAKLVSTSNPVALRDLLSILSQLMKGQSESGSNEKIEKKAIPQLRIRAFEVLSIVARDIKGTENLPIFLEALLSLGVELASSLGVKTSAIYGVEITDIEMYLYVLAEFLHNHTTGDHLATLYREAAFIQQFRQIWFFLIMLGLVPLQQQQDSEANGDADEDAFNMLSKISPIVFKSHQSLSRSLARIAAATPPLVAETKEETFQVELAAENYWKQGVGNKAEKEQLVKEFLIQVLPTVDVKSKSPGVRAFLFAIYHVETLRPLGSSKIMSQLLAYEKSKVFHSGALQSTLEPLLKAILQAYVHKYQTNPLSKDNYHLLEIEAEYLLIQSTNTFRHIGKAAQQILSGMIKAFPQLLWSQPLFKTLLDIVTASADIATLGYDDEFPPLKLASVQGKKAVNTVEFSSDYDNRNDVVSGIVKLATEWVSSAVQTAPNEVNTLIQDYLVRLEAVCNLDSVFAGLSLALQQAATVKSHLFTSNQEMEIASSKQGAIVMGAATRARLQGQHDGVEDLLKVLEAKQHTETSLDTLAKTLTQQLYATVKSHADADFQELLRQAAAVILLQAEAKGSTFSLLAALVWTPIEKHDSATVRLAVSLWRAIAVSKSELELLLIAELTQAWEWTRSHRVGLFAQHDAHKNVLYKRMTYSPPAPLLKVDVDKLEETSHSLILDYLLELMPVFEKRSPDFVSLVTKLVQTSLQAPLYFSHHYSSRLPRFQFAQLAFKVLGAAHAKDVLLAHKLREPLYNFILDWFSLEPTWSRGPLERQTTEIIVLIDVLNSVRDDRAVTPQQLSASVAAVPNETKRTAALGASQLLGFSFNKANELARVLLENEIERLVVWRNPRQAPRLNFPAQSNYAVEDVDHQWPTLVRFAWSISPQLAVRLSERFNEPSVVEELKILVKEQPALASPIPGALKFLLTEENVKNDVPELVHVLNWAPVPPPTALSLFLEKYHGHDLLLTYAGRCLRDFPAENILFYTPQVVQSLRFDKKGFVERYIAQQAKLPEAQLLAHQLLWNMNANSYLDIDSTKPDPLKPVLDRLTAAVLEGFEGPARDYYKKEVEFFEKVTGVSGALKPFIKSEKDVKKAKIAEELGKIVVVPGVYLPSNPNSVVLDIDYTSGRPLQSHAKAPYMATFKVEREVNTGDADATHHHHRHYRHGPNSAKKALAGKGKAGTATELDVAKEIASQSCIFKVGDDCRQDVLALQLTALFQAVFSSVGLDVYTFPYKVVATAPGCGIIEVVPGSTSRDSLGREKVNDLYAYFVTEHGAPDSAAFQLARSNFIKSMAAYSVIVYLLTLRDRHNGNILIDDQGHIIHIDFGFILGISPGGVVFNDILNGFETSPFLLKKEMIDIMGGSVDSAPFMWFSSLVIQAFLAARPFAEEVVLMVKLMSESGLPCFRGEETLRNLRDRFQPKLSIPEAARFMQAKIQESKQHFRTAAYDSFQYMQNKIPY